MHIYFSSTTCTIKTPIAFKLKYIVSKDYEKRTCFFNLRCLFQSIILFRMVVCGCSSATFRRLCLLDTQLKKCLRKINMEKLHTLCRFNHLSVWKEGKGKSYYRRHSEELANKHWYGYLYKTASKDSPVQRRITSVNTSSPAVPHQWGLTVWEAVLWSKDA